MSILIVILLLVLSVKQLINGGLFIETSKNPHKLEGENLEKLLIAIFSFVGAISMIIMELYVYCLGFITPGLLEITVFMVIFHCFRLFILRPSIDDLGKFTLGSVLEDMIRVGYYCYFLYVLI